MSRTTRRLAGAVLAIAATALIAAGCGSDDEPQAVSDASSSSKADATKPAGEVMEEKAPAAMEKAPEAMEKDPVAMEKPADVIEKRAGALGDVHPQAMLEAKSSEFGTVLWDQYGQVVYAFEADKPNTSNCYGDCADFWPPMLTKDAPKALAGVDQAKLGTTKRKDGAMQVTYNGWPLYYVDEPVGEIRCHNHDLHGGLWWVIAPSGDPVKTGKS